MSDERDELAHDIPQWQDLPFGGKDQYVKLDANAAYAIAGVLIEKGYRKPRQVTTVEELDALANGSVVLDADRATATRLDADYWEVAGYASHFRIDAITLPATVLHVGGAE